jgi:hypothetical protein
MAGPGQTLATARSSYSARTTPPRRRLRRTLLQKTHVRQLMGCPRSLTPGSDCRRASDYASSIGCAVGLGKATSRWAVRKRRRASQLGMGVVVVCTGSGDRGGGGKVPVLHLWLREASAEHACAGWFEGEPPPPPLIRSLLPPSPRRRQRTGDPMARARVERGPVAIGRCVAIMDMKTSSTPGGPAPAAQPLPPGVHPDCDQALTSS